MTSGDWQDQDQEPTEAGWYECLAVDDRWDGKMAYRAWGNGSWCIPLEDSWLSMYTGVYKWRGPVADVDGPAPDGTNPQEPDPRRFY